MINDLSRLASSSSINCHDAACCRHLCIQTSIYTIKYINICRLYGDIHKYVSKYVCVYPLIFMYTKVSLHYFTSQHYTFKKKFYVGKTRISSFLYSQHCKLHSYSCQTLSCILHSIHKFLPFCSLSIPFIYSAMTILAKENTKKNIKINNRKMFIFFFVNDLYVVNWFSFHFSRIHSIPNVAARDRTAQAKICLLHTQNSHGF